MQTKNIWPTRVAASQSPHWFSMESVVPLQLFLSLSRVMEMQNPILLLSEQEVFEANLCLDNSFSFIWEAIQKKNMSSGQFCGQFWGQASVCFEVVHTYVCPFQFCISGQFFGQLLGQNLFLLNWAPDVLQEVRVYRRRRVRSNVVASAY